MSQIETTRLERICPTSKIGRGLVSILSARQNGLHESFERSLDRRDGHLVRRRRPSVGKRRINVPAQIGRHFGSGFPDDEDVPFALDPDEVAGLENNVVPRGRDRGRSPLREVVILGEQENPADRALGGLLDLLEDSPARDEVYLPVQHFGPEAHA